MQVVTVLGQVFGVCRVESETVAAGLQLGHVVVTLPVLVAGAVMRVEAEIVRTLEALLSDS